MYVAKLFVVAATLSLGAASFAQEGLTREAVLAEMARAQAAGEIDTRGEAWDGTFQTAAKSGVYGRPFAEPAMSREEVNAELQRARSSGEIARQQWTDYVGGN